MITSFVGHRVATATVPVRRKPLRLPLLLIPWWLLKLAVKLLLRVAGSPVAVTALTALTLTWRHRGEGPQGYRIGRHVRYRRVEVEAWLHSQADTRMAG